MCLTTTEQARPCPEGLRAEYTGNLEEEDEQVGPTGRAWRGDRGPGLRVRERMLVRLRAPAVCTVGKDVRGKNKVEDS